MKHRASSKFWKLHDALPEEIRAIARRNFDLLKADPAHPSLHFKKVGALWSIRVGLHYRALGVERDYGMLWFWIGSHAEYDRLTS